MAQNKKVEAAGPRARLEIEFEQPHLLGPLFGEFDRNLIAIEDRHGVYIAARGAKVQIEGDPHDAARAREVLIGLYDMLPTEQVERRIASGEIEIAPIAFMRGRTLSDAFIILDEAQNTTPAQMKMFLTRFGMRSRMVVCGDPKQVDLPEPGKSGLHDAVARLEGIDKISMIRFGAGDVVRHPLVGRIVEAYEGRPE